MTEHRNGTVSFNALRLIILSAVILVAAPEANAEIYLNELVVRGTEQVEIYNSGDDDVDLTGWLVRGSEGDFMIPNGTVINPGQYLAFTGLGGIMSDLGAEVDIIDDIKLSRDSVDYGQLGGAPLPHDEVDVSLCRAPDASTEPPLDPINDADLWTLDFDSTFGAANDAPQPDLGSTVVINEVGSTTLGVTIVDDSVELFNPSGVPLVLIDWVLTFGAGATVTITSGTIGAGGFYVEKLPASIELDTTQLVYLFDDTAVRVDQMGWSGTASRNGDDLCLGRCPDGAGTNDGYDVESSEVGTTVFVTACSLGGTNGDESTCGATPVEESSWGSIKTMYR